MNSALKFRGISVYHMDVKTALSRSGLPDLDYALNPYVGCGHGCVYCYARTYTADPRARDRWGKVVIVKDNLVKVLAREIRRLKPGIVGVGTITDAYQPVEAVFKLTRSCISILLENGFRVSIQTKNALVLRDLDIMLKHHDGVDVGFTITTLNANTAMYIEPFAPPPKSRETALRKLNEQGVRTWIFYGPIIPGINDDYKTAESVARLALETNSTLYYDCIRPKPFMNSPHYPLRQQIVSASRNWWKGVENTILKLCREYGITCKPGFTGDAVT